MSSAKCERSVLDSGVCKVVKEVEVVVEVEVEIGVEDKYRAEESRRIENSREGREKEEERNLLKCYAVQIKIERKRTVEEEGEERGEKRIKEEEKRTGENSLLTYRSSCGPEL
jgi:hypothetical protein